MLKKLSTLAILTSIVLIDPLQAIAQQTQQQQPATPPGYYYGPGPWHMWNDGVGFWWMGPVMMFLFLLVIFGAIFFFMRGACGHAGSHWGKGPWHDPGHSALQILNERFAKGEIQKEEYAEKKAAILSHAQR